jgi:type IV secretion system protein TrbL
MTGAPGTPLAASSPFDQMTAALEGAFARVVELLLSFWTSTGVDPSHAAGADIARQFERYTGPLTVTAATIGVVIAGTRMAVTSSRAAEPARDLLRGLGVLTLVWWGGVVVARTVGDAFDEAGRHVLTSARVGPGSVAGLESALRTLSVTDSGLVFLLCLVGALSGLVQFVVLLLREPALALLAGGLPIAAGAAVSGFGGATLKRLVAWTAAFTGYKFLAALVYAAAFSVIGTADDLTGITAGIALVVVAVAALPALVRLITPALDATLVRRGDDPADLTPPASGAVLLGARGRMIAAPGPPSDAGPQTRPGLLAPSGSGPAPLRGLRRPVQAVAGLGRSEPVRQRPVGVDADPRTEPQEAR